jgi:hypothetical protein
MVSSPDAIRRALIGLGALAPAIALVRAPPVQAAGDDAASRDLDRATATYHRATMAMDVDALSALVAEDYVLVNSDSSVQDKASYLADFRLPDFRLDPYVVETPFRRIWSGAALAGGTMRLAWSLSGRRHRRHLRFVHIWALHDGGWRLAFSQLTQIPD